MTWVKLDDTCPDHPSILGLSDAAFACWVRGLCFSSRHLTDGFVPTVALRSVGTVRASTELVSAGKWKKVDGGWHIHGYEDHQRTRVQVQAERERWRQRQARTRNVTPESPRSHRGVPRTEESRGETDITPLPPLRPSCDIDLTHHPIPKLPDEIREANLDAIAALKAERRPTLTVVDDPATGATA